MARAAHAPRPQCAVNVDRNLIPKLAIMRQCTSVTDRLTDRQTDTDIVAVYITSRAKNGCTYRADFVIGAFLTYYSCYLGSQRMSPRLIFMFNVRRVMTETC